MSLVTNVTADTSDVESIAESETAEFYENQDNLIAAFLTSEVEERQIQKKKEQKAN